MQEAAQSVRIGHAITEPPGDICEAAEEPGILTGDPAVRQLHIILEADPVRAKLMSQARGRHHRGGAQQGFHRREAEGSLPEVGGHQVLSLRDKHERSEEALEWQPRPAVPARHSVRV